MDENPISRTNFIFGLKAMQELAKVPFIVKTKVRNSNSRLKPPKQVEYQAKTPKPQRPEFDKNLQVFEQGKTINFLNSPKKSPKTGI